MTSRVKSVTRVVCRLKQEERSPEQVWTMTLKIWEVSSLFLLNHNTIDLNLLAVKTFMVVLKHAWGGQIPTKKGKKKAKKGKKSKKVKVEDNLLNTDDLRAGSEPMIDVNLDAPQA